MPVIAIDTPPLARRVCEVADYVSHLVYSPLSAQLFRWDARRARAIRSACCRVERRKDGRAYLFYFPSNLPTGGKAITAGAFVESWEEILKERLPAGARLAGIAQASVLSGSDVNPGEQRDVLLLELEHPDVQLANKLAHPALGAYFDWRPESTKSTGTHYKVDEWCSTHVRLVQQTTASTSVNPSVVEFRCIPDGDDAIEQYQSGQVDYTCPASFPLHRIAEFSHQSDFRTIHSNTLMVMVPMSHRASDIRLRRWIADSLDVSELESRWPTGLERIHGFTATSRSKGRRAQADVRNDPVHDLVEPLTIIYDDFHPNGDVAEQIAGQLCLNGLRAQCVTDDYLFPHAVGDFKLMVICNSVSYAADLYRRLTFTNVIPAVNGSIQLYSAWLDMYDMATSDLDRQAALSTLDSIIEKELPVIPLVRLNQFCLTRLPSFNWHSQHFWDHRRGLS